MMKKIFSLLLVLMLFVSLTVLASATSVLENVYDDADLLSDRQQLKLSNQLRRISDSYGVMIAVCTVDNTPGWNADAFIEEFYDSMGLGYGADHAGILLMVCMDIREYRILSNGAAADALTMSRIDKITDAITPDLSDGDYADAFEEFADQCEYYLDGHINGFPFEHGKTLAIALAVGLVIGLIVAFSLKAQLKSVRMQTRAHDYVKPDSMRLTYHSDLYLYRTVRRTRRESSSSSRSGGSRSRSVGGGRF